MLSWLFSSSSVHFLLHPYLKRMRNAPLAPSILQCSFLIKSLLKNDQKFKSNDKPTDANSPIHGSQNLCQSALFTEASQNNISKYSK